MLLDLVSPAVVDNRDEAVFPNCEFQGQPRFEELLRCGPRPGVRIDTYNSITLADPCEEVLAPISSANLQVSRLSR